MICIACQLGLIAECYSRPGKGCKELKQPQPIVNIIPDIPSATGPKQRASKNNADLRDPTSTGRKRAARDLPLIDDEGKPIPCEWAGLKFAGGGEFPIIGCDNKLATHRHHGPDKDTTNNRRETPRNIHAICAFCHNRWHGLNDENYEYHLDEIGGPQNLRPHDSETRASDDEIRENELKYAARRKKAGIL